MNLGMGLIAADEFFKAGDARKEREFIQAKRDAELGLLPDETRAKRAKLGLDAATDEANTGLVPDQQRVAGLRLEAEGGDLKGQIAAQPEVNRAKKVAAKTQRRITEFEASDVGRKLYEQRITGAISIEQLRQKSLTMLADLIDQGDEKSIISFTNSFGMPQGAKEVVKVQAVTGKDGRKFFQALAKDGSLVLNLSADGLAKIRAVGEKGEYTTVKGGETIVHTKGGKATPLYTAPETSESATSRMGPIERDIAYFEEKFGMTKEQALAQINSAKTQTRETFIMKQVEALNGIRPAGATDADIQRFSQMYDRIRATGGGSALVSQQPGSNNPAPATVSPETRNLLGLP